MERIFRVAEDVGCRIIFRDLGDVSGFLYPTGLIVVNSRRTLLTQRITVAHELGHWFHKHDWRHGTHDEAKDEREADLFAARMLISMCAYMRAENAVGPDPRALGHELDVPPRFIRLWRESWASQLAAMPARQCQCDVA